MEKYRKVKVEIYSSYSRIRGPRSKPEQLVCMASVIYRGKTEDASLVYGKCLILPQAKFIIEVSPKNPIYEINFSKGPEYHDSSNNSFFYGEVSKEQKRKLTRYLRDRKLIKRVQGKIEKKERLDRGIEKLEGRLESLCKERGKI